MQWFNRINQEIMEVSVLNINGQETGRKVQLNDAIFGIEPNDHVLYLDVKQYLANQRQGTAKSKERTLALVSEVLLNVEVENVIVRLNSEDCVVQLNLSSGLLTVDI